MNTALNGATGSPPSLKHGGKSNSKNGTSESLIDRFWNTRWLGFKAPYFFIILFILAATVVTGKLPPGFVGGFAIATVFGAFLDKVGDNIPFVKDYLGGGTLVALFGGAFLVYFNILPDSTVKCMGSFVKQMDYLGMVVSALICGSILGMDRKLLISAGLRYVIPILGGLGCAALFAYIGGAISGFGGIQAVMMVCMPIMGGGTAAGAVPLAQIYGGATGISPTDFLSKVMPAVGMGNALAVVAAGLLNRIGERVPKLTGNGRLMKDYELEEHVEAPVDYLLMGQGFVLTGVFFGIGILLSMVIPLHYYALTIIAVAVVKIANLFPDEMQESVRQWSGFITKIGIPAVLFTIGAVYTDMELVLNALTPAYAVLCVLTVVGAALGAGLFGFVVKFFFVESAISAGLCMANMGGSGDVATLSAGKRMILMPFAQVSSRLGGALILIICSLLVSLLGIE